jgi:outer membrane protein assembly complex protein YaeT
VAVIVWQTFTGQLNAAPPDTNGPPAKLKISGYGLFGNRELKRIIHTLELSGKKPRLFGPNFVEDSAMILSSRIRKDGYLKPSIEVHLTLQNGSSMSVGADELIERPLPRDLLLTSVHFQIRPGRLYYYDQISFAGLATVPEKQARSYFAEVRALLKLKRNRVFTPEKLRTSCASLRDVLERQGHEAARVRATSVDMDDATGAVKVGVAVEEGPRSIVRSVRKEFYLEGQPQADLIQTNFPNQPYSRFWVQDFTTSLKTNGYRRGYPDNAVEMTTLQRQVHGGAAELDLLAVVRSGPLIHVGKVEFSGEKRTQPELMASRVKLKSGDLLNPIKAEEGRYRLAQLGSFDHVELKYDTVDDHTRDVMYRVQEGKSLEVSLLFGFGSYELLRGGVELEERNIWGLGHHLHLKAVQSFKASSGDLSYTIPEFLARDMDVFLNAFGLRREEVSFTREEYGGGIGTHRYFRRLATDISVRYNYQILNAATPFLGAAAEGLTNAGVGAIITDFKHDRRDNPLYPGRGYKIFGSLEAGTEYLGGDANFERLEIWSSVHLPLGEGRLFSLGLSHGAVFTPGRTELNLPVNRRFFPGGQNSIRGYQEGEASPRNDQGRIVGAETYTLGTVEFEQPITPKWSIVVFSDSLGFAHQVEDYPFRSGLFSVGGGLRWRTVIGPVRLEYGHNLNPRPRDPSGTLQFSLGFPF